MFSDIHDDMYFERDELKVKVRRLEKQLKMALKELEIAKNKIKVLKKRADKNI